MQLQRVWTDAGAEIRFWQLMRTIEEMRGRGPGFWSRLTLGPQRAARRAQALRREAETLVERFTLSPGAVPQARSILPDEGERTARIHSAIRVAATLANDAAPARAIARERVGS